MVRLPRLYLPGHAQHVIQRGNNRAACFYDTADYKSTLMDTENDLLTVYRYIELNPVRAGMVPHAVESPWSSYQGKALGKPI